MAFKALVAYATHAGSTKEVAEAVGGVLRDRGHMVDLLLAKNVRDVAGYDMVVLGAPLYMFHWHNDAKSFLDRNRKILEKRPIAIFALGPFENKPEQFIDARGHLDKDLAKYPWLAPIAVEVFGGKFDPTALHFPYNLIPAMNKIPPCDIRDWTAIRAWAENLPEKVLPVP